MKTLFAMLAAVTLATGAALANPPATTTTTTTTTTEVSSAAVPAACPIVAPVPQQCAAIARRSFNGQPIILVNGYEEAYGIRNLPSTRRVQLEAGPTMFLSETDPRSELNNFYLNPMVARHGNPYYPYYQVNAEVRVAGIEERLESTTTMTTRTTVPAVPEGTFTPAYATTLTNVRNRYAGLTTQQAQALGYQPVGTCTAGMGQAYVNTSVVDNNFDPMTPEAFIFDQNGRLLAVAYIQPGTEQRSVYGMNTTTSTLVNNSQQMTVWLYADNPNGMYAPMNPQVSCGTATLGATTGPTISNPGPALVP